MSPVTGRLGRLLGGGEISPEIWSQPHRDLQGCMFPMPESYGGDKLGVFEEHRRVGRVTGDENGGEAGPLVKITVPLTRDSPAAHLSNTAPKEATHCIRDSSQGLDLLPSLCSAPFKSLLAPPTSRGTPAEIYT